MNKMFDVVAAQNRWINTRGQIPPSSSNQGFLNAWHDLTNDDIQEIINDVKVFAKCRNTSIPDELAWKMFRIHNYIEEHKTLELAQGMPNIANPTQKNTNSLRKHYGKNIDILSNGQPVKREFFRMMREIAEFFNSEMNITLDNKDAAQGTFDPEWDGLDPEWEPKDPKQTLFDY